MPAGATRLWRSDHRRSKISASATIDAMISGQIGQPAAWMSDNTVVVSSWLNRRNVAWLAPIGQPDCATSIGGPCLTASATPAWIGDRRADGRTRKDDDPAQVDPQQEDRQRGQRAVDHFVGRYLRQVPAERVLRT